jgi:peroxiredoxin
MHDPQLLPPNLPAPVDDGRARHLSGARLPKLNLRATSGATIDLQMLTERPTVLFFYPRTGVPGQPPNLGFAGESWDEIPGARGCTPQNCAFRDLYAEFASLGVQVFGVSTQTIEHQSAFKARNHVPFEYLSDAGLFLVTALSLPTFEFPVESGGPNTLIARMSCFANRGRIEKVWYPVFPPNEDASRVLSWLESHLPLFCGVEKDGVTYRREADLGPNELAPLFQRSGIGRPHAEPERLARMLTHANLVVTARVDGELVGVSRTFSDFAWVSFLCDLAVARDHQRRGIGRTLVELTREAVGSESALVLVAAPGAESYYPPLGFDLLPAAFRIPRTR